IFGITQSPFIVFAANVFALMGLRQLYFLLGDLIDRLVYLKYGIAFILAFIGVMLVFHVLHENEVFFINVGQPVEWIPVFNTWMSLGVIVAAMAVATIASLIKLRRSPLEMPIGAPRYEHDDVVEPAAHEADADAPLTAGDADDE